METITISMPDGLMARIRWYVSMLDEYDSIEDYFMAALTSSVDMDMDYSPSKKKMPFPGIRFQDEYRDQKEKRNSEGNA